MKILLEGTREELIQVIPELGNSKTPIRLNKDNPDNLSVIGFYTTNSPNVIRANSHNIQHGCIPLPVHTVDLSSFEFTAMRTTYSGSTAEVIRTDPKPMDFQTFDPNGVWDNFVWKHRVKTVDCSSDENDNDISKPPEWKSGKDILGLFKGGIRLSSLVVDKTLMSPEEQERIKAIEAEFVKKDGFPDREFTVPKFIKKEDRTPEYQKYLDIEACSSYMFFLKGIFTEDIKTTEKDWEEIEGFISRIKKYLLDTIEDCIPIVFELTEEESSVIYSELNRKGIWKRVVYGDNTIRYVNFDTPDVYRDLNEDFKVIDEDGNVVEMNPDFDTKLGDAVFSPSEEIDCTNDEMDDTQKPLLFDGCNDKDFSGRIFTVPIENDDGSMEISDKRLFGFFTLWLRKVIKEYSLQSTESIDYEMNDIIDCACKHSHIGRVLGITLRRVIPNCNLFQTNKIINTLTQKINNRLNSCV